MTAKKKTVRKDLASAKNAKVSKTERAMAFRRQSAFRTITRAYRHGQPETGPLEPNRDKFGFDERLRA
jgi:hypothetical protein